MELIKTSKVQNTNLLLIEFVRGTVKKHFLFDTGASKTVISTSTALEYEAVESDRVLNAGDTSCATASVPLSMIRKFCVGTYSIDELEVFVIDDSQLEFELEDNGVNLRIDGLLGWDVIQQFRWTYDHQNHELVVDKPKSNDEADRLLEWDNMPLIEINHNGKNMTFGLDTGHTESILGDKIYSEVEEFIEKVDDFVGILGTSHEKVRIIPKFDLNIGNTNVTLNNIPAVDRKVFPTENDNVYGLLGNDILENRSWVIDYTSGYFELR